MITSGGEVVLPLYTPTGDIVKLVLSDIVYSLGNRYNLVSLSLLYDRVGLSGQWGSTLTIKTSNGYQVGQAKLRDGLYYLSLASIPTKDDHTNKIAALVNLDNPV
jgi:hypothetical protein